MLQDLEELVIAGKYNEALEKAVFLLESIEEVEEKSLSVNLLLSRIFYYKGEVQKGLRMGESTLDEARKLRIGKVKIGAFILIADGLERLGKYNESLKTIKEGLQRLNKLENLQPRLSKSLESSLLYLKGKNQIKTSEIDQALVSLTRSIILSEDCENKVVSSQSLLAIGNIKLGLGDEDIALEYFNKSKTLCEDIGYKFGLAHSEFNIALINHLKFELDKAVVHFQVALRIFQEIEIPDQVILTTIYIGYIYYYLGDLNQAMHFQKTGLDLCIQHEDNVSKTMVLNGFGDVYRCRGDLTQALNYYQQTLDICEELNITEVNMYRYALRYMGRVYYEKYEITDSLQALQKALKFAEKAEDNADIAYIVFHLILANIEVGNLDRIDDLLAISEKNSKSPSPVYLYIQALDKISRATILNRSKRLISKSRAQSLLIEAISHGIDYEIRLIAMISLCELLIEELEAFGEERIIDEIGNLIHLMDEIAKKQRSLSVLVELDILRSKLAFLLVSSEDSINLLKKAKKIAEDNGIELLVLKCNDKEENFRKKLSKWEEYLKQNDSLREKIEEAELQNYLIDALSLVKADSNNS